MQYLVILLALMLDVKHETYPTYEVPTLHVNHYYNDDGKHILSQLMVQTEDGKIQGWLIMNDIEWKHPTEEQQDAMKNWRNYPKESPLRKAVEAAYPNLAWQSVMTCKGKRYPIYNHRLGVYEVCFKKGRLRGKVKIETWTQFDAEVEQRKEHPPDKRTHQKLLNELSYWESTLCTPEMDKLGHPLNLPG